MNRDGWNRERANWAGGRIAPAAGETWASGNGRGNKDPPAAPSRSLPDAGIAQAVCEGLALSEKLGLDPERLLPTLLAGAASNWFLDKRGATMLRGEYSVGFKLALLHKDLKIVRELAAAAGTDRSVIEKSLADYAVLQAQGYGDEDISALIRLRAARASARSLRDAGSSAWTISLTLTRLSFDKVSNASPTSSGVRSASSLARAAITRSSRPVCLSASPLRRLRRFRAAA